MNNRGMLSSPETTSSKAREPDYRPRGAAFLLLTLVVLLVFGPAYRHDFLNYDDDINVTANDLVRNASAANLRMVWQQPYHNLYIPLTYSFWQLQAKLSGISATGGNSALNPKIFHGANLLVHLANVLLVFLILGHLLPGSRGALAGALIFAVHPVQVEPVAWVTGFKDLFSGFWYLLAIWQFLVFRRLADLGSKRSRIHYGLTLLFLLCAMLAKPGTASLPLVIALLAFVWAKRNLRQTLRETWPLAATALPFVITTTILQSADKVSIIPSVWQRILICGDTFSFYLSKVLLPVTLGPYYGRTPEYVLTHNWVYLTGVLPYLLLAGLLWKGSRQVKLAAGIFVLCLLPVSGLIPFNFQAFSTVADRYLYLPLLGVALGVGLLTSLQKWGKLGYFAIIGLIALSGVRSMPLVHYWHDSITFNEYGLRSNPNSWYGHNLLGVALALNKGDHDEEAYRHFAASLKIRPTEYAYNNMAAIQDNEGKPDEATALYLQAIQLNPNYLPAYKNLARLLARTKTMATGEQRLEEITTGNPKAVIIHLNFGTALFNIQNFYAAIPHLEKAISQGDPSGTAKPLLTRALAGIQGRETPAAFSMPPAAPTPPS